MSSDNKGIARLLQAEKDAAKIIQEARNARKARLQQAKLEAKRDVDAYMAERQAQFDKFKNEHQRGTSAVEKDMRNDTEQKIASINSSVDRNVNDVVDMLLKYVIAVDCKVQP